MSTYFTTYSPLYGGGEVSTLKVDTYSPNIGEFVHTLKLLSCTWGNVTSFKVDTYSPNTGEKQCRNFFDMSF